MNRNCVVDTKSYSGYEDGGEVVYLKLVFNPIKCSQCNWKDGWNTAYWKGQHPCRLVMVKHENYYSSGIEADDFGMEIWAVVFKFTKNDLNRFAETLPFTMGEERMLESG
jgi:hypothetical protein